MKLVSTTQSSRIKFRQLHAEDGAPIKQERRCSRCEKLLPYADVVKGVEVAKDEFVTLTDEELAAAEPESSRVLRVTRFVPAGDVSPAYVERSYAVAPDAGGERAYALLREALARRNEVALGRVTMRGRERAVALRPEGVLLFGDVLHFAEEVRDLSEVEHAAARESDVSSEELELADLLMDRLAGAWDPSAFTDSYSRRVREIVDAKARGERVAAPAPSSPKRTDDLLAALRATLEAEREEAGTA